MAETRQREKISENKMIPVLEDHKVKVQLLRSKMPPAMRNVVEYKDSGMTWKEVGLIMRISGKQARELYKRAEKHAQKLAATL